MTSFAPSITRRILQITADGRPAGGVTNVLQLCEELAADDAWRVAICSQTGSYVIERAKAFGASVHEIDFFRSRFDPTVYSQLARVIREVRPDPNAVRITQWANLGQES